MRKFTKISMLLIFCLSAAIVFSQTFDLGNIAPEVEKTTKVIQYDPSIYPPVDQGGETIALAVAVTAPYTNSGTTSGYFDDYEEVCPYASTSPDVVYSYTPTADEALDIDLLGSLYDTKLFVYEDAATPGAPYACNDDYHPDYTSAIFAMNVYVGHTYYIIIDGYGGASGVYDISIIATAQCTFVTPPCTGIPESEACGDDENGGCNMVAPLIPTWEIVNPGDVVIGTFYNDGTTRDTDWYELTLDSPGYVTVNADAISPMYIFELTPADCNTVGVGLSAIVGPCTPGSITTALLPAGTYWFFAGSTTFTGFPCDQDYWIQFLVEYVNDECATAHPLPVSVGSCSYTLGNLDGSTNSGVAPSCSNYAGGDVWFSAVVPATGKLTIEGGQYCEAGSFSDGAMTVWTGTCGSLTEYECDDDDGPGLMPMIIIDDMALAGQTIYINFWEYGGGSTGPFYICAYTPPPPAPGDDCTMPIYATQGLNNAPQQPVWYEYTTTGSGHLEISSYGAGVDTRLYVYSDCSGTLVAGDDDFWGWPPGESMVRFSVGPGETYHILWGDNYSTAPFTFSLIETSLATSWTGGVDNDWWNTGNWSSGIPGYHTSVTVPAGLLNNPTVGYYAVCHDIFLGSDASGTATLVDDSYLLVNGTATVQRYYPTGATTMDEWHLISAPITNALSFIYTSYYLQWFDEANVSWNDIIPNTTNLTSLQGFAFYAPTNGMTFNYAGNLGNGPYGINISASGTHPDGYHWNLFGNPYPSSLDWAAVAAVNGSAGTGNLALDAVYYLDQSTANYEYYVGGIGSPYVPPGQGFMVAGANDGSTFTVDNSMRTHSGSGTYYKSEFDNLLVLEAAGSDYSDVAYLRFDDGATEDVDRQFDAVKLFTDSNPYLPQLYTVGGTKLAINVLPETAMVPAGFIAGVPGIYTINIKEVTGMANVVLEDLVMETQTDLLENEYTFNYDLNDPEGRFIIHFTPLAVGENLTDLVNIYSYNKDVYVKVPENTKGNIVVFNTMGQEVARTNITDALNIISLEKGAYYVVKVMSNESVVTKKVFVK